MLVLSSPKNREERKAVGVGVRKGAVKANSKQADYFLKHNAFPRVCFVIAKVWCTSRLSPEANSAVALQLSGQILESVSEDFDSHTRTHALHSSAPSRLRFKVVCSLSMLSSLVDFIKCHSCMSSASLALILVLIPVSSLSVQFTVVSYCFHFFFILSPVFLLLSSRPPHNPSCFSPPTLKRFTDYPPPLSNQSPQPHPRVSPARVPAPPR